MLDMNYLSSFFTESSVTFTSELVGSVAYNPSLLYSTLIIAILLTKGYGRNMAIAIGRKILHEPSRKIWRTVRAIKPRQIMYYGLRWGIPLHQLKDLLLLHRNIMRKAPRNIQRVSSKNTKKSGLKAKSLNSTVNLYRKMPLNMVSRLAGKVARMELPLNMREPLFNFYIWSYGVNIDEALDGDLRNYKTLSEFFCRRLKPNAREVDSASLVTSPADGCVLHFGKVENGVVEQVKGVNYSIKAFLGPNPSHSTEKDKCTASDTEFHQCLNIKPGNSLYHCIVYLAPGDYHRFHSPADWAVRHRRHFPGELLSVKPSVARWVQGLFNMNERVVYTGDWKYGYFSYTAVGATNVGSIKMYIDPELETNAGLTYPENTYFDKDLVSKETGSIKLSKGEMLGEFNFGSTIVVMFEAPENFQFSVEPGQKVLFGQSLGSLSS